MKKRVCALLLGTVMLVSLTACGGGGTSSGTSQAAGSGSGNSEEPVTITYYTWETAEENNPVWQEIEDELNIRVEVCICLQPR